MSDRPLLHPEKDELVAFGLGKLDADEATKIESHLGECDVCCETLLDLKDDTFVELVRNSPEPTQPTHDANDNLSSEPKEPADGVATDNAIIAETMLVESGVSTCPTDLPDQLEDHPRYRIIELIGKGGMGDVYKAEHRLMDRPVALKLINQDLVKNVQAVERFRREVRAAARLTHPNIVTAYDAEQAGDVHFLVMEFVDGVDLASEVQNRRSLPIAEACDYVRQAAEGLQHAHKKGMVHRDIKPHNLMLNPDGQVRILDFGLASFATESALIEADATDANDGTPAPLHLTTLGSVMGTPDYIAPEQARDAHSADIRADIYSLGCTLYFLLSGETPHKADSVVDKLKAHAEQEPRAIEAVSVEVPDELAGVIRHMMAKDPAERFQTPAEVADALAPFVDSHRSDGGKSSRSAQSVPENPLPITFALCFAGTLSTLAFVLGALLFMSPTWLAGMPVWSRAWLQFGGMLSLPAGVAALILADRSERKQSHRSAVNAGILNLLPLNPFVVLLLPLTVWTLLKLRHPSARVMYEHCPPLDAAEDRRRWPLVITSTACLVIAIYAASIFFVHLGSTTLKFEVDDPTLAVRFSDETISIDNDGQTIHIKPGKEQEFFVEQNGVEVETGSMTLRKGDKVVLRVSLLNGGVSIDQKGADIPIRNSKVPAEDAQAVANDRRLLEDGRWKVVEFMSYRGSRFGTRSTAAFIVFKNNKIIYLSTSGEVRREDDFRITNSRSTPKTFKNVTWPAAESNSPTVKFAGVYDLQGDSLKLYFGPTEGWLERFESQLKSHGPRAATVYFELTRERSVKLNTESRLQGKWVPVSGHMRTKAMSAEQLSNTSVTFEGNRVTLTDPDSGRPMPPGTFTIDTDRDPNHITMTAPDGSETLPGIFRFAGDQLRLAWVDEDYARPTDFSSSDTADHMTLVLEQTPLAGPAPGETERDVLKAANEFLAVMDAGTFGQLYDMSASWAKRQTTRGKTSQTHQKIRDSFGKALQRTLYRAHQIDQDPNLPKGRYAVVLYKSRFERQPALWETLVLTVDTDSQWRVITYAWTLEPQKLPAPKTDDAPATTQKKQAALTAAQQWLNLVDSGQYGDAWEACAEQTRKADDQQTLVTVYTRLFQSVGKLESRELLTNKYATDPSGEFVNIQYDTQFARTRVTETIALTKEKDDQWRVSGYFHEPRASAPTPPRQTTPQRKTGILTNPPSVPTGGLPTGKNLIEDPSLENTQLGRLPKSWSAWLDDGPDFKCEVVEGGVTGQHCLQISGKGTRGVVFATSIAMDRTKRYALKGRVRLEGEDTTWAVIKINYFNKSGWLGVDDRAGVTAKQSGWQFLEKTDRADAFPEATLMVPTCHIEGNGTAWFDDLELVAYDRDKLPVDFDEKHGKNNRK